MIIFGNYGIVGTHESPVPTPPELHVARTHFSGLGGESEIWQGTGGRDLRIRIILHNRYATYEALDNVLVQLEALIGRNETLRTEPGPYGGLTRNYYYCTFHGFSKDESPDGGPLPDYIGSLDGATPSWWVAGWLTFRQLAPI